MQIENTVSIKSKSKFKTIDTIYIGMFIALITICSWITIPFAIPFTMQTFAIFTAVLILGMKKGTLALLLYIILGAFGAPVFSGFRSGPGVLLGTTGGYLIGFIFSSLFIGKILQLYGKKLRIMIPAMIGGLIICYFFGTLWFMIIYTNTSGSTSFLTVLSLCVFPFILPDCFKIALAIIIDKRLGKYISL